jgi:hypothetical protein
VLKNRIKVATRIVLRKCFKTKRGCVKAIGGGVFEDKIKDYLKEKYPRWQIQMHETKLGH